MAPTNDTARDDKIDKLLNIAIGTQASVTALQTELKETRATLYEKIEGFQTDLNKCHENNAELKRQLDEANTRIRDLEDTKIMAMDRLNSNYLILNGIQETGGETAETLTRKVNLILQQHIDRDMPCTSANRVGRNGSENRPIRIYWMNQEHRNYVLTKSKYLPKGLYLNKDIPAQLREISKKIRKKAGELYRQNIRYEYCINGIK